MGRYVFLEKRLVGCCERSFCTALEPEKLILDIEPCYLPEECLIYKEFEKEGGKCEKTSQTPLLKPP